MKKNEGRRHSLPSSALFVKAAWSCPVPLVKKTFKTIIGQDEK